MNYIGIDISSESFHSAKLDSTGKSYQVKEWSYQSTSEIENFAKGLNKATDCFVMEATGMYHLRLAYWLVENGYQAIIVNPLSVKRYRQMKGSITKTDKADAIFIAQYAVAESDTLKPFVVPQQTMMQLTQRRMVLNSLQNQLQIADNQLHALSKHPKPDPYTITLLGNHQTHLKEQIQEVKQSIAKLIDQDYNQQKQLLLSIPGFGENTANAFIEVVNTFDGLEKDNATKAFTKYIGLAPTIEHSGKSVRKQATIARGAAPMLRAKLFLPALTVCTRTKADNIFKSFYLKLRTNGKSFKEAIVAVMHKMVRIAIAVIKSNSQFNHSFSINLNIPITVETK